MKSQFTKKRLKKISFLLPSLSEHFCHGYVFRCPQRHCCAFVPPSVRLHYRTGTERMDGPNGKTADPGRNRAAGTSHHPCDKQCDLRLFLILSRLVDTFFSRISLTMPPAPKSHNTAYVLPWEEPLHWQSRSSGYSSS